MINNYEQKCGVMFVKKGGWLGWLVSLFQLNFKYDHVAIFTNMFVYEMVINKGDKPDIVYCPIDEYRQKNKVYDEVLIPEFDELKIVTFMDKNKTKKYDWKRSIGWLFRRFKNFDDLEKWNCVDMVYWTFIAFDLQKWNGQNISPSKLYKILK